MYDYNCPDCNEAKLQSDKNARKINEIIGQVNQIVDNDIATTEYLLKKADEIVRETAEIKITKDLYELRTEVLKKGHVTLNDFDEPTRALIQGLDSGQINAVLGDKNVTPENTTFIDIGKNLFNKDNPLLVGCAVDSSNNVIAVNQISMSHWIYLTVGETYTVYTPASTFFYILEFDEKEDIYVGKVLDCKKRVDTTKVEGDDNNYTFVAEHKYCIICYWSENPVIPQTTQFEKNATHTTYEEFKYILSNKINIDDVIYLKNENEILKSRIETLEENNNNNINFSIFDLAYIKNNELDCNNDNINGSTMAKYTCCDFGENPSRMMCKARFVGGGTVAIISMPNGMRKVDNVTNRSIHITFNSGGSCSAGVFEDKILTNIEILNYSPLDVTGETIYEMGWRLNGNTLTVFLPDGTSKDIVDERWGQCNGKYLCWEHFNSQASVTENNRPIFKEFYALGSNNELKDYFLRQDGAIGIAPTGQVYAQFRNV